MWKISPIFVLHKLHCPPQIIRTLELTHKLWTLSFRGACLLCAPLPLDGKATHRARQCADPSIPAQAQFVCGLDGEGGQRD